jgi:hypothetical protein
MFIKFNIVDTYFIFFGIVGEDISSEVNTLQFDFNMIRLATNKFSEDNKIGEGGFGDVYKVIN